MQGAHIAVPPAQRVRRPPSRLALAGDERLARLVTNGSERAFATLYERHHQQLYRYCRSLLGNDSDAQDALQSTFTNALVALRRGPLGAPLRPWLFRIAHNESISLLRRRRPVEELSDALESQALSVEYAAHERERLALLVADLHELSERQRGALVMRELSGLSYEEVALALGISVGTAKQTVLEARQSLQEFAEGREMACDEIQAVISSGDGRVLRRRRVRAHMRSCTSCSAFAAAIDARRADLLALSPMLPAAAAAGMLRQLVGGASGHGGGSGGLAAGSAGKMAGAALSTKAIATTAALVATTAVGAVATLRTTGAAGPVHRTPAIARGASKTHGALRVDPGARPSSTSPAGGNESAYLRARSLRGVGAVGPLGSGAAGAGAGLPGSAEGAAAAGGSSRGGVGALPTGAQSSSGQVGSPGPGGAWNTRGASAQGAGGRGSGRATGGSATSSTGNGSAHRVGGAATGTTGRGNGAANGASHGASGQAAGSGAAGRAGGGSAGGSGASGRAGGGSAGGSSAAGQAGGGPAGGSGQPGGGTPAGTGQAGGAGSASSGVAAGNGSGSTGSGASTGSGSAGSTGGAGGGSGPGNPGSVAGSGATPGAGTGSGAGAGSHANAAPAGTHSATPAGSSS